MEMFTVVFVGRIVVGVPVSESVVIVTRTREPQAGDTELVAVAEKAWYELIHL
ncbi:hypothetical protein M7I_1569 [Glarea lozoyensis 74030]|uniref:Uncharacterized protein n=1 Tax=Glarea lozoyensis (strain ATCC 74030 / MF5533) TaxID=1104152 RepID=H0EGF3_GLAL7|nr:hypothetical protein M7I_1569 [Glarea lozoyensis 74030]